MPYVQANDPYASADVISPYYGSSAASPSTPGNVANPVVVDLTAGDVDFNPYAKGVRVGTGGTLNFVPSQNTDSQIVTLTNVANGEYIHWQIRRICKVGTTCTNIVPIQGG